MRLLVCGDRNWSDREFLYQALDAIHAERPVSQVIEGMARGSDVMAADWAISRGIPVIGFRAQWDLYRKAAGPIRNQQMIDVGRPDAAIAFHDRIAASRGTRDMVIRARKAGIELIGILGHFPELA
jgi:hypothetical protein